MIWRVVLSPSRRRGRSRASQARGKTGMRRSEELAIAKAARRTRLKWAYMLSLAKKLEAEGADAMSVHKAVEDLAEALRSR